MMEKAKVQERRIVKLRKAIDEAMFSVKDGDSGIVILHILSESLFADDRIVKKNIKYFK